MKRSQMICIATAAVLALSATPVMAAGQDSTDTQSMYRVYNKNSGEHFYTASAAERDNLVKVGWKDEGIGWTAPRTSSEPVYRLYNKNSGDHHYTTSVGERNSLIRLGWKDEGIGWYSDTNEEVPLYRQYNPNAKSGSHNYTTSKAENDALVKAGWKAEGIGWYGVKNAGTNSTNNGTRTNTNNNSATTDQQTTTDPNASKPTVTFEQDPGYVVIEANVRLTGTGTGYHAKIDISGSGTASFGIQYEQNINKSSNPKIKAAGGKNNTVFLLENVMSHATEAGKVGKNYTYIQNANLNTTYKLRLSWHKEDNTLHCFVNDKEIYSEKTTFKAPFTFATEGSCAHNGDSIDATFTNVRIKAGDGKQAFGNQKTDYGTIGTWNDKDDFFGLEGTVTDPGKEIDDPGPTQTFYSVDGTHITKSYPAYDASMHITGTARIGAKYDWDTCFSAVEPGTGTTGHPLSAIVKIAQTQ